MQEEKVFHANIALLLVHNPLATSTPVNRTVMLGIPLALRTTGTNQLCSHPQAFCLRRAASATFRLPARNDVWPLLNAKLCQGLPRRPLACPEPKLRQGIQQNGLTEFQFLCPDFGNDQLSSRDAASPSTCSCALF